MSTNLDSDVVPSLMSVEQPKPPEIKPKLHGRQRPSSKANITAALNDAVAHSKVKSEAGLERERLRAQTSAAHDNRKGEHAREVARLEQEGIALKKAVIPSLKEAMKIFNEHSKVHFEDIKTRLAASKVLRTEENCAFFLQLGDDL